MSAAYPFRMAVFDMDDTLLGPDHKVSPANQRALEQLRSAGVEVVIASGRYASNIAIHERSLGFLGWIISAGGAVVSHAATGEIIFELTVPPDLALEVFHRGREAGISIIGYHSTGIFCDAPSEWIEHFQSRTGQAPVADIPALIATGMQKLIWTTAPPRITELTSPTQERYRDRLYVVHTEPEMLEFLNPNTNKARAVEVLAKHVSIPRDQIIAFGDGNNDVPLLAWAGYSVAMAHGRESARHAAKKVSPPGDPGTAVARALEEFFPS
jgi:Cof subfamily protein (haloacid dehalogenase superfamily)